MIRFFTILFIILIFVAPYSFSWGEAWWKFIPSSIIIILAWRWASPATWTTDFGIRFFVKDIAFGIGLLVTVGIAAHRLIGAILSPLGYISGPDSNNLGWKYLPVFQVLNEEMILRAFLLTRLNKIFRQKWIISIFAAAVFVFLHFLFYRYGKLNTTIEPMVMITLFFFALAGNSFFLETGNIVLPFAIHLGWNLTRFGEDWVLATTGTPLQEAIGFNLVEGDQTVTVFAVFLTILALVLQRRKSKSKISNTEDPLST